MDLEANLELAVVSQNRVERSSSIFFLCGAFENMICVRFEGGLGNQMFQYAAGKALAARLGTELIIDTSWFDNIPMVATKRKLEIDQFNIEARPATPPEITPSKIFLRIPALSRFFGNWTYVSDSTISSYRQFEQLEGSTYLFGYWQDYRYFSSVSDLIYQHFSLRGGLSERGYDISRMISLSPEAVSVHVRRGDYLSNVKANIYHGVLPLSYYKDALIYLKTRHEQLKYFVFSDDIEWCKSNFTFFDEEIYFVDSGRDSNPCEEMILMSHCRHHIMANSTFSWWAAWLSNAKSKNLNGTVIMPHKWFVSADRINYGRVLDGWITL